MAKSSSLTMVRPPHSCVSVYMYEHIYNNVCVHDYVDMHVPVCIPGRVHTYMYVCSVCSMCT